MRISCEYTHAHRVGGRKSLHLVIQCKTLNLAASLITHIPCTIYTDTIAHHGPCGSDLPFSLKMNPCSTESEMTYVPSTPPAHGHRSSSFLLWVLNKYPERSRAHTLGLEKRQAPCLCDRDHMRHTILDTSQSSLDSLGWGISLIIYILQTRDQRQREF